MDGLSVTAEPPNSSTARKLSTDIAEYIEYPDSRPDSWYDWKWQLKNRITSLEAIRDLIPLTRREEEGIKRAQGRLAMAITPYFFSLIDRQDPKCPIRKQAVPRLEEFSISSCELVDQCGEDSHSPVPGLVHRYHDRALLIVNDSCA